MKLTPRIPILLSAFGFPGLGQFVQKRWIPGVLFAAAFLVCFFRIMKLAIQNIIELYTLASSGDWSDPNPVPISAFVRPLVIVGIVYLLSLIDTFLAQLRINSKRHKATYLKELNPTDNDDRNSM